jgi:chromosome segregation ATPase
LTRRWMSSRRGEEPRSGEQLLDHLEHQAQEVLRVRAQLERVEQELERERVKRRELEAALQRAREDVFVWRSELADAWARINTLQQRLDARRGILRRTRQKPDFE